MSPKEKERQKIARSQVKMRTEMNAYEKELHAKSAEINRIVENAEHDGIVGELCYHLMMKREYDGLNGRRWDSTEHLRHEDKIKEMLGRF